MNLQQVTQAAQDAGPNWTTIIVSVIGAVVSGFFGLFARKHSKLAQAASQIAQQGTRLPPQ